MYAKDVFFSWNSLDSRIRMLLLFYLSGWWMLIGDPLLLVRQKIPRGVHCKWLGLCFPAILMILRSFQYHVAGRKGLVLYLTGSKNPTFLLSHFWEKPIPGAEGFFFCIKNRCYIIVFFQWLGIKQSHCGQWICSIWLFLHVFKRCHLISIPFDAQLLQRTWQKSRILVVKSHDENPR